MQDTMKIIGPTSKPSNHALWLERGQRHRDLLLMPFVLLSFIALWQGVVSWQNYPDFILPTPAKVGATFIRVFVDGTLWHHAQTTLFQIFCGLALGLSTATIMGYILAKSDLLEKLISPYLVALQSIPVVAMAPLLIIWFGSGSLSKILICALIVFFPALINTIVGLRAIDPTMRELMHAFKATRWQIFLLLELPGAMPVLLGGLKVSVTLSVIGAVVGEFMGANQGLGFLINQARGLFDTPLVFVAILSLVIITLSLYGIVSLLERRLLHWRTL